MTRKPLRGLAASAFMRRFWQRKPLLLRGAFADFADPLSAREIFRLAASPDAACRLVRHRGSSWTLEHGPFFLPRIKQLPRRGWTLLVADTKQLSGSAR